MKTRNWYVYILSNPRRTVLYIGITNDIARRMFEHRSGKHRSFAARYNVRHLMHYETFDDPMSAICREKQLKHWIRARKDALIQSFNPNWKDLSEDWTL